LTRDVDLEDVGVWQGAHDPRLCSFKFTGGHYSLEDRDVVIAWVTISFQEIVVDSDTAAGTNLQVVGLV
jgi:hypothetical protein